MVAAQTQKKLINLCFHGLGPPELSLDPGEEKYWLSLDAFEEILSVVRRQPAVRITFDDGNASDVRYALPALLRYNLTASFFVLASRLDKPGYLTSGELRELVRCNMTVGSHGMWHRPWRSLDDEDLRIEVVEAATVISNAAAVPVSQVACPFGSYDRRVLKNLRRNRFVRVYTVDDAPASSDAWLQSRYTVLRDHGPDDIERFTRTISGSGLSTALSAGRTFIKRLR